MSGAGERVRIKIKLQLPKYKAPVEPPPFFCVCCEEQKRGWQRLEIDHPQVCHACNFPNYGRKFSSSGAWDAVVGGSHDAAALNAARAVANKIGKVCGQINRK